MFTTPLISIHSLLDLFFPRACLLCRTQTDETHHLCPDCAAELPILSHSCQKCAQFLHANEHAQLVCGLCLSEPPPYDKVYALFPYQSPIPSLIIGFKFEEQFSHGRFFSHMLLQKIHEWYAGHPLPDLLIPMPLHPARLRERGFNQAAELTNPLASALKIPIDHSVIRQKATLPQRTLRARERGPNLAHAFAASQLYTGCHLAIIDDVVTTGETITALARLLRQLGAARIDIWCCARCDSRP